MIERVMVVCPYKLDDSSLIPATTTIFELDYPELTYVFVTGKPRKKPKYVIKGVEMDNVVWAYNKLRAIFLKSPCEYVLTYESDIIVPKHALRKLLRTMEEYKLDIVAGLYRLRNGGIAAFKLMGNDHPADLQPLEMWDALRERIKKREVIETDGLSFGLTLFKRKVFEKIRFKEKGKFVLDFAFFEDAYRLGFRMGVDSSVECGHIDRDSKCYWPMEYIESLKVPACYKSKEYEKIWQDVVDGKEDVIQESI